MPETVGAHEQIALEHIDVDRRIASHQGRLDRARLPGGARRRRDADDRRGPIFPIGLDRPARSRHRLERVRERRRLGEVRPILRLVIRLQEDLDCLPQTGHGLFADLHAPPDARVGIAIGPRRLDEVGASGEEPGILRTAETFAAAEDDQIGAPASPATKMVDGRHG